MSIDDQQILTEDSPHLMQDWATQAIRDSTPVQEAPKDYNGDVLDIGQHVMFAWSRNRLAEGVIVDTTTYPDAVTIKSLHSSRIVIVESAGTIKVAG